MSGQHIELFLVDGEPGGITTANVSGWTGHILSGPRTALTRLLSREEAHRNGVYLLLGDNLMPSRTSPTTSEEQRTFPHDSVGTTAKRTGGTGQSSSAAATTPSMKGTGATSNPVLLKSPPLPSAAPFPITLKPHKSVSSQRLSSQTRRLFSTRSGSSFPFSVSASSAALRHALRGRPLLQTSILLYSHSPSLSAPSKPAPVLSGTSSSCWRAPALSANGPTRAASRAPAEPTSPTAPATPSSSMTEVSPSMVHAAHSHETSPFPRRPRPAPSPPDGPAIAVLPGSGKVAPTGTGRTGTWIPHPSLRRNLLRSNESVLP